METVSSVYKSAQHNTVIPWRIWFTAQNNLREHYQSGLGWTITEIKNQRHNLKARSTRTHEEHWLTAAFTEQTESAWNSQFNTLLKRVGRKQTEQPGGWENKQCLTKTDGRRHRWCAAAYQHLVLQTVSTLLFLSWTASTFVGWHIVTVSTCNITEYTHDYHD